jgi:hypothetical protein
MTYLTTSGINSYTSYWNICKTEDRIGGTLSSQAEDEKYAVHCSWENFEERKHIGYKDADGNDDKVNPKGIGLQRGGVYWIKVAQNCVQWQAKLLEHVCAYEL